MATLGLMTIGCQPANTSDVVQQLIQEALDSRATEAPPPSSGEQGDQGLPGADGAQGSAGDPGADGISCWDINGNGVGDFDEDVNADGNFDSLDCQGPDGQDGLAGQNGLDGLNGTSCWDVNDDGVGDPGEDVNADGNFDFLDCQGQDGLDGQDGVSCWDLNGNGLGDPSEDLNTDGNFDSLDCQGPSGPIDATEPTTPDTLRVFPKIGTPPEFELRWTMPASPTPIQFLTVYEAEVSFTDPADASVAASVPGTASFAVIRLFPNSGVRHFRIQATSFTGVNGPLSAEYKVDTTSRIAFLADIDTDEVTEVYVTRADGGLVPVKVSGSTITDGDAVNIRWSPDGTRLAFRADREIDDVLELYIAVPDGSEEPVNVSGALVAGGNVSHDYRWSPDGTRIAFYADKETDEVFELYVAPADGGTAPVNVSGDLVDGGDVLEGLWSWSPDSTRLAFLADKETDDVTETYVVSADGSTEPLKVSGALPPGGVSRSGAWSPDSQRLAFRAQKETASVFELYVVPADGSAEPVKISGAITPDGDVFNYGWSPDGTRVDFMGDIETDGVNEVFVTTPTGGDNPTKVSGTIVAGGNVFSREWSPDSSRIAILGDKDTDAVIELYVALPTGGGEPTKVSGALVSGGSVSQFTWSPDGDRLAFLARKDSVTVGEAYVVQAIDGGEPTKVSGTLVTGGSIGLQILPWSPDGTRVAFRADKETDTVEELYVVVADGAEEPAKVSGILGADRDVGLDLAWSPLSN
jgi:Tol biopolymer transport system component